jgi:hypothetical protein
MINLRILPGTTHLDAGHVAAPDVVEWIADRFAGAPSPTTCLASAHEGGARA